MTTRDETPEERERRLTDPEREAFVRQADREWWERFRTGSPSPAASHRHYLVEMLDRERSLRAALASPPTEPDVDAAWEALRVDLIGEKDTVSTIVFRHRPLIEAAIERRALTRYAIRTVGEASDDHS